MFQIDNGEFCDHLSGGSCYCLNSIEYGYEEQHCVPSALLTLRSLTLYIYIYIYIYGALILDVSRSHTTTQHSR